MADTLDVLTLAEGKFHLTPPPADTWEGIKQAKGDILAFITKKHDAVMAIQLLPGDMEINPFRGVAPRGCAHR